MPCGVTTQSQKERMLPYSTYNLTERAERRTPSVIGLRKKILAPRAR